MWSSVVNIADLKDWADILSKLAMPFLLAWVGLLLLRQAEERKAGISRSSDFKKRWADNFYDSSHEFMSSTERYMSALNQLQGMKDPNGTFGTKLQQELSELNVRLGELHLRIQRLAYFAPSKGPAAIQAATGFPLMGAVGYDGSHYYASWATTYLIRTPRSVVKD